MTISVGTETGGWLSIEDLCHMSGQFGDPCSPNTMRVRVARMGVAGIKISDGQLGQLTQRAGRPRGRNTMKGVQRYGEV